MGYLRRLDSNVDIQAFPGALFEAAGDVPAPQCSEALIEGDHASVVGATRTLTDVGAFEGFDLTGKVCHITVSPDGNTGDFDIADQLAPGIIELVQDPGTSSNVVYHISDGGELILTRDTASLAAYIHAAGYAYTFKGGKLWTNMPSGHLKNACTILFDPIT